MGPREALLNSAVGGVDRGNELMQFSECIGIQQVDQRIVEDDAPKGWRILGCGELPRSAAYLAPLGLPLM
jgi:hypothetical protein